MIKKLEKTEGGMDLTQMAVDSWNKINEIIDAINDDSGFNQGIDSYVGGIGVRQEGCTHEIVEKGQCAVCGELLQKLEMDLNTPSFDLEEIKVK